MKNVFNWIRENIGYEKYPEYCELDERVNLGLDIAIDVVNEAEEKWKEDYCEWKSSIGDDWTPSCESNATYNVFGVAWFKYCPYCGKRIKEVK